MFEGEAVGGLHICPHQSGLLDLFLCLCWRLRFLLYLRILLALRKRVNPSNFTNLSSGPTNCPAPCRRLEDGLDILLSRSPAESCECMDIPGLCVERTLEPLQNSDLRLLLWHPLRLVGEMTVMYEE